MSICPRTIFYSAGVFRGSILYQFLFFFNDTATTEIYTLSLHDALPIWARRGPHPVDGVHPVHPGNPFQRPDPERSAPPRSGHPHHGRLRLGLRLSPLLGGRSPIAPVHLAGVPLPGRVPRPFRAPDPGRDRHERPPPV